MADQDNILQNDDELSEEQILKYLEGNLTDAERHRVELQMADSTFVNDAVEGLEHFKNKKDIHSYVDQLNHQLQKHTEKKKKRKTKRRLTGMDGLLLTIVMVLLLCVLGYIAVRVFEKYKHKAAIPIENKR